MTTRVFVRQCGRLMILAVLADASWVVAQETIEPPPNAPARVEWNAGRGRLSFRYHGGVILDASIRAEDATGRVVNGVEVKLEPSEMLGEKVEQRLKFIPAKPQEGVTLVLSGTVTGSEEAFPAETPSEAQKRFPYVRNSVGLSHNLRNNAVYDRRWDWVLIACGQDTPPKRKSCPQLPLNPTDKCPSGPIDNPRRSSILSQCPTPTAVAS